MQDTPEERDDDTPGARGSNEAPPRRRHALLAAVLLLFVMPALGLVVGLILLQVDSVSTRVVNEVLARTLPWEDATASVTEADLSGIGHLVLRDLRLEADGGEALVRLDTLDLRFRPAGLAARRLDVRSLYAGGLRVDMRQQADSTWDLLAPFESAADTIEAADSTGRGLKLRLAGVEIRDASLRAVFSADSVLRVDDLDVVLDTLWFPDPLHVVLDTLDARIFPPSRPESPAHLSAGLRVAAGTLETSGIRLVSDSSEVHAAGTLRLPDEGPVQDIDFEVRAMPLDFRDVGTLVPGFDAPGSLRLEARVTGAADSLQVRADAETWDGATAHVEGTYVPRPGAVRYALEGTVRDLDPALWTADRPSQGRGMDADFHVALSGTTPDSLDGTVHAEVSNVRLGGATLLPTTLQVRFERGEAAFETRGAADPWARFDLEGSVRPLDSVPRWDVRGTVRQLDALPAGGTRLADAVGRIEARGTGITPGTARGTARLELDGTVGRARIRDGSLTARWDSSTARFALELPAAGGLLEASGRADWGGERVVLALESLETERLEVAELFADTVSGFVSLNGSAEAVLTDRGATMLEADLAIEQGAWRDLVLDTGTVSVRLREGRLVAHARAVAPGGVITVAARGRPYQETPTWQIDSLRVRTLDLSKLSPGMPASELHAVLRGQVRGTSPETLVGRGTLALDSSRVAGSRVDAVDLRFALDGGRLRVEGDARALGGTLELQASGRPFASTPTFTVERARFDSVRVHRAAALEGETPIERLSLSGALVGSVSLPPDTFPQGSARLWLDGGHLNGSRIDTAAVVVGLEGARARLDGTVRTTAGYVDVQGAADLAREDGALSLHSATVEGDVVLPEAERLAGSDSVPASLTSRFALQGSGTRLATMVWDGVLTASGRYGEAYLDSLALDARLDRGVLFLDTLSIQGNVVRGGGGGAVALLDSVAAPPDTSGHRLRLWIEADSMASLAGLVGMRPLSLRGASLQVEATREDGAVRVEGTTGAGGLITPVVSADTLLAEFSGLVRNLAISSGELELEGRQVALTTSTILETTHATVEYDSSGAAFDVSARKDEGHDVHVQGKAQPADSALVLDTLNFQLDQERWRLVRPATVRWGNRIDPDSLTLVSDAGRIALAGHLDRTGTQDLTMTLDSVPVDGFAELLGLERLQGVVDGVVEVTGPAEDIALDAELGAVLNGARVRVLLHPVEGPGIGIEANVLDEQSDPLDVVGTLPVELALAGGAEDRAGGTVALDITARAFSPGWLVPFLQPLGIERLDADLSTEARLEGTLEEPSLTGTAAVARGSIAIPAQGISYEDVRGALDFQGDRIVIDSLLATAGGTASVEGEVILEPLADPTLELEVETDRFLAANNDWTRLVANGRLTVTGALSAPVLRGSVQLENTDVFANLIGESGSAAPVELTREDYQMLEAYFGYTPSSSAAVQREALELWTIDLSVDMGTDVWLRRSTTPEINVQLMGSLDVRKQPGDSIQLFGTVEVLPSRSYFEQFGRRFDVSTGSITFNGPVTQWQLDAVARHEVPSFQDPTASEVTITLDVEGSPGELGLTLGSEPQMENADVISYLATGRPAESAAEFGGAGGNGEGGGVLGLGEELAISRVAGLIERSAAESVGLDVVEIRQSATRGTILIAGRYVNPRLFVGFQQPLTTERQNEDPTRAGALQTEVEVEYTWFRWLLVNVQGGQSALRFFLRTKHAF